MLKVEAKNNIDKTMFRESIKLFRRYNIISNIDSDITKSDARIKIYPSILLAIPNENINQIYEEANEKLNKYINRGEQENDEETNED